MHQKCKLFFSCLSGDDKTVKFSSFCGPELQTIVRSSWIIKREVARVPRSSVRSKSSFMPVRTACVHVEAGVVARQWRPLRLRLHCCPLVNDQAVGSCSSVDAVIKHSKPTGWQQAHFLAPGLSVEKETCLMLCFPAQWNPTREERYKRKHVWFWGQIQCISTDSQRNFSILCFSGVNVNLTDTLGILTQRWLFLWRLTLVLTGLFKFTKNLDSVSENTQRTLFPSTGMLNSNF